MERKRLRISGEIKKVKKENVFDIIKRQLRLLIQNTLKNSDLNDDSIFVSLLPTSERKFIK